MTETKAQNIARAVKNPNDNTVFIYRAALTENGNYSISIERYSCGRLQNAAGVDTRITDTEIADRLILEMCMGQLEPCHLKDVIEDMNL